MAEVQPPPPRTAEDIFEPGVLAKYDPKAVEIVVATANAGRPRPHDFPIDEVRADEAKFEAPWCRDPAGWPRVVDASVPSADGTSVPVKVYHPDPVLHGPGPYGVHLNFHGGGFVLGGLTSESSLCRSMSEGAGVVVVDVNYRHCPEAEYGKCMEDGWAALQWVCDNAGQLNTKVDSVSVGGVSAGGAISLVLQHMARDAGVALRLSMATVPPASTALTYASPAESPYPSFHEFAYGPVLPFASIKLFGEYCFPRDQLEDRLARIPAWWLSPILAPNFAGLCDTFIRTAECDALRDEGEAYGMKSIAAGNRVTMKRYLGSPHTFMFWDSFPQKQEYDRDSIHALRLAHGFS